MVKINGIEAKDVPFKTLLMSIGLSLAMFLVALPVLCLVVLTVFVASPVIAFLAIIDWIERH